MHTSDAHLIRAKEGQLVRREALQGALRHLGVGLRQKVGVDAQQHIVLHELSRARDVGEHLQVLQKPPPRIAD